MTPVAEKLLRVKSITWEAVDVVSILLDDPEGFPLPSWGPGAHIDVRFPNGIERQYSLCGDLRDPSSYRVAILKTTASRGGSSYVHDRLRVGDLVITHEPLNNFRFLAADRYRFVAGGIGITPLIPMIAAAAEANAEWDLLYGGRTRASMAFLDVLAPYGERVQYRPQDAYGLLDLPSWLGDVSPGTLVYCCGPEPLLRAVEELSVNWPGEPLQVERFAPRPDTLGPGEVMSFEVVCKRSRHTVTVSPGTSILDAVRAAGVVVPSSCQEGVCGTCETQVIDGTPEHRDSVLSKVERAESRSMMICVSRATSPRLILDL